ncbi:MAG: DUF835 domain-containing protein [Thermoplasmatota archaeon]
MVETLDDPEKVYRILIADDDPDILNLLRITLESTDKFESEIVSVSDGLDGRDELQKSHFDLVIADHKMPGLNGTDLLAEARETSPDTARVLITGFSALEVAKEAINKAKVDNYIEKPWDNEELRDIIHGLLTNLDRSERPSLEDIHIERGSVYLFEDENMDRAMSTAVKKMGDEMDGLFVSRIKPDRLKERYDLEEKSVDQYWLTRIPGKRNLEPSHLELLADKITRYLEKNSGVVLLEGIESLIRENSFERIIGFFENLVDVISLEEGILLVVVDPRTLDDQKLALIERNMNVV